MVLIFPLYNSAVLFIFFIMMMVIVIGSIMYLIEGGPNSDFTSIPRSIYWAVVTLTTVGYGDIAPITALGQFLAGIVMVGVGMLLSSILSPKKKNAVKEEAFECGIPTQGPSWLQFKVGYYLFAILFLIFDVETVFIFPWATVMKEMGMVAFIEILIFLVILGLGLIYAWKKDALRWD